MLVTFVSRSISGRRFTPYKIGCLFFSQRFSNPRRERHWPANADVFSAVVSLPRKITGRETTAKIFVFGGEKRPPEICLRSQATPHSLLSQIDLILGDYFR